jgi:hypothetical protein
LKGAATGTMAVDAALPGLPSEMVSPPNLDIAAAGTGCGGRQAVVWVSYKAPIRNAHPC